MGSLFTYLHGVAILETVAFLYLVEQRPTLAPRLLGLAHFCIATALVAGAFASYVASMPHNYSEPVSVLLAGLMVGGVSFLGLAVAPLVVAWSLRRRRSQELGADATP